jgi:hypothetical protein
VNTWDAVPVSLVDRPGKEPLEVHRCEADGALVTKSPTSLSRHVGHRVRQPVILTEEEHRLILEGKII